MNERRGKTDAANVPHPVSVMLTCVTPGGATYEDR